ncbi:MAG TPA: hypothetical protein PLI44_02130 [Chiayiivirga sp.]|nr:hypothetical protein [Chiayiivirga sp.]
MAKKQGAIGKRRQPAFFSLTSCCLFAILAPVQGCHRAMNSTSNRNLFARRALAAACVAGLASGGVAQAAGQGPESWREFARRSIMPDYAWNDAPTAKSLAPTLRDQVFGTQRHRVTFALSDAKASVQRSLTLSLSEAASSGLGYGSTTSTAPVDLVTRAAPVRSQFFDATFQQEVENLGRLGVTALVARQQFATPGLGLMRGFHDPYAAIVGERQPITEMVTGHGVRFDYRVPVGDRVAWAWSAQSRLDMSSFESVRGIYGEPGDFDLPARLGGQLEWQAFSGVVVRTRHGAGLLQQDHAVHQHRAAHAPAVADGRWQRPGVCLARPDGVFGRNPDQ